MSAQKLLRVLLIAGTLMLPACGKSGSESNSSATSDRAASFSRPAFTCEQGQPASGDIVDVKGSGHTLLTSPDVNASAVVNEKASQILGKTQYHSIDSSIRVQIQCEKEDWVRVQLTEPEWLTHVKGWTKRENLLLPRAPGEARTFTEQDISWDKNTSKYKEILIQAINRIHREDPRCKDHIDPGTVSLSPSKSQPNKPVFFVTCGTDMNVVNVFFTPEDVASSKRFTAPKHIDHSRAVTLCETYAKNNATHPSTVDFSRILHASVSDHPNGRTTVISKFTAKNSFNLELTFDIRCLLDENGLIEGVVNEAK